MRATFLVTQERDNEDADASAIDSAEQAGCECLGSANSGPVMLTRTGHSGTYACAAELATGRRRRFLRPTRL